MFMLSFKKKYTRSQMNDTLSPALKTRKKNTGTLTGWMIEGVGSNFVVCGGVAFSKMLSFA